MPTPDTRTPSEHDCDRILYSDELRRLGGVTQVLAVGEAPLFHTRLTHTLKVQQLARRLAEHLYRTEVQAAGSSSIDVSAAEAAGLAHDLGHPPFGHVGEQALHQKCEAHGLDGFEGNAQTFRILTKLGSHPTLSSGLGISSKTLAAVVKYPWQRVGKHAKSSKWNAYMTESKAFEDCRVGINEGERSIEAQIMDWADDVTYAVHDLEDFARSGHVPLTTLSDLEDSDEFVSFFNRAEERLQKKSDYKDLDWSVVREDFASMLTLCFEKVKTQPLGPGRTKEIRDGCRLLISEYISGAELSGDKRSISISPKRRCEVDLFKQLTWHYVIHDPRLATLQEGYVKVVNSLFDILMDWLKKCDAESSYYRLPLRLVEIYELTGQEAGSDRYGNAEARRARAVADYIAGLTEGQALDLHGRLTGTGAPSALDPWVTY